MAVAHRLLTILYVLIRDGGVYRERGGDYFDRLHPERTAKRMVQRLERIGFEAILKRKPLLSVPISLAVPAEVCSKCHRRRLATCMHDNPKPKRTNRKRQPTENSAT